MSQRTLILIALAIFALALYTAGFKTGTFVLLGLAVIIELWFWIKVFRLDRDQSDSDI